MSENTPGRDRKLVFLSPDGEGIIRPMRGKGDPEIAGDAVMIMIPAILHYLTGSSNNKIMRKYHQTFFELYIIHNENESSCSLAGPFLGAPQAVMGMEKLIALGAERVWVIGYCGSLYSGLRIGDILIPVNAVSEEGTSPHYPIDGKKAETDMGLNKCLEKFLHEKSLPYRYGRVWTTDAPYRETAEKIKAYGDAGIMGVEMELSALITVAAYRKVRLSALLLVSDELFDLKWRPGFSSPLLNERSRQAGELMLDLIAS
ncbi:MAG: nucleoside phosphorylase [Deltaproteobacteria bacterium]|nr:nucleoside phosphorylase [Deltaproteobacteria bacterium]